MRYQQGTAISNNWRFARVSALAVAVASLSLAPIREAGATAAQVRQMAGREDGLCVVIGCGKEGQPSLAAQLAASGKMLVHGIAFDGAALGRAREAVTAAGVDGLATIEKLPLAPLPYRDNLANVIVVEDLAAATAAGFSRKEALRVLAPFGTLCVRKDGKWDTFRKPLPKEMDEWTHEAHGPDGNCVSKDKVVHFPVGFRWHAGLAMNIQNVKRPANAWSSTRGLAVANGRCFTLSTSVLENLGPASFSDHALDQYVTARDAFNGSLLWRRKIGATYYGGLFYTNRAPFAAIGDYVYAATGEGKLVALNGATGEVRHAFDTTYAPGRLLIDQNVVVAATWKDGTKVGGTHGVDRRRMDFSIAEGSVEAFDAQSFGRLWQIDKLATSIRSKNGILFMVQRVGADELEEGNRNKRRGEAAPTRPQQAVVAVNLKTGNQLWEVTSDKLGGASDYLRLDAAGPGVITVSHNNGAKTSVLSARDGKKVFQGPTGSYTAFIKGAMHLGGKTYNPATGKESDGDDPSVRLGATICTPYYFVNNIIVANRSGGFIVNGKPVSYGGARGGCLFASVPAYGAFYTPQNWCACAPAQIPGFIVFGPIAHQPTPEEMAKPTMTEKGPAFDVAREPEAGAKSLNAWPMYRHSPQRSNATPSAAPTALDVLWERVVAAPPPDGLVGVGWREYLNSPVTAPVVAEGMVVAAAMDRNQVFALDAETGEELWRQTVGGRVDTPPTIHGGRCLFGAHDGYVYSLSSEDGRMAWKMRAAPREERMVSYGKVESPWPVVGTVLVTDGLAYASAGRTQGSDGGIVVRAFEPTTGQIVWSKAIAQADGGSYRDLRRNDLMLKVGDTIQLMQKRLAPATGEPRANKTLEYLKNLAQLMIQRDLKRRQEEAKAAAKAAEEAKAALVAAAEPGGEMEGDGEEEEEDNAAADEFGEDDDPEEEEEEGKDAAAKESVDGDAEETAEEEEDVPDEVAPAIGLEGFVSWIWTRLGSRKYKSMSLGNLNACMLSSGAELVCASTDHGRKVKAFAREDVKPVIVKLNEGAKKWEVSLGDGYQATALVVCGESVVIGGGVYGADSGGGRGFVRVVSADSGKTIVERLFGAPLTYNGLVVVAGKVYATFADGSAVCLGQQPKTEG